MNEPNDVITVIDEEHMALFFYSEHLIVHHQIRKPLPEGEFMRLLETGIEYLIKYHGTKWLSDDRGYHHLTPEENDWAECSWAPRAVQAGFKYWAVLSPSKGVGKIQMSRFVQEFAARGVTVGVFETPESALEWLRQQ